MPVGPADPDPEAASCERPAAPSLAVVASGGVDSADVDGAEDVTDAVEVAGGAALTAVVMTVRCGDRVPVRGW